MPVLKSLTPSNSGPESLEGHEALARLGQQAASFETKANMSPSKCAQVSMMHGTHAQCAADTFPVFAQNMKEKQNTNISGTMGKVDSVTSKCSQAFLYQNTWSLGQPWETENATKWE